MKTFCRLPLLVLFMLATAGGRISFTASPGLSLLVMAPTAVRTTIHMADLKQIPRVEATYQRIFGAHRPARAVIVNSALPVGVFVVPVSVLGNWYSFTFFCLTFIYEH